MSLKGKLSDLFSFRNILIILIVVIVVAATIVFITSEPSETADVLTVKEVVTNSGIYIESGEEITVKGYYHFFDVNKSEITDSVSLAGTVPGEGGLIVDYSGVEDVPRLDEGNQYLFTGVLQKDNNSPTPFTSFFLKATKIK